MATIIEYLIIYLIHSSFYGFANALSFKKIETNDLEEFEKFIKIQLHPRLADIYMRKKVEFTEHEKVNFFGIYAASISDFQLHRGERKLLQGASAYIKELETEDPKNFLDRFAPPKKYKINKNNTEVLSVGLFFGTGQHRQPSRIITSDGLKADLLPKMKKFFEIFSDLEPLKPINEELIDIIDLNGSFRADVICVYCSAKIPKKFSLQCDLPRESNSVYWNLSNFRRHITHHHTAVNASNITIDKSNDEALAISALPIIIDDQNNTINESLSIVEKEDSIVNATDLKSVILRQFSVQNAQLEGAALKYNESKKFMQLEINKRIMNIHVQKVDGNGDCLFSTLALQLEYVKNKSKQHKQLTTELRQKVVAHITTNFEKYLKIIEYRLLDEAGEKGVELSNIKEECFTFISHLSSAGYWGGAESIRAVSELFEVNILTFNEKGSFFFPNGFDVNNKRTIFLAYRLDVNENRYNHYDSICCIGEDLLYTCACDLVKRYM